MVAADALPFFSRSPPTGPGRPLINGQCLLPGNPDIDRLLETIGDQRDTSAGAVPWVARDAGSLTPLRILLAEDNAINQKVALCLLERLGCGADVVGDGRQALARLDHAADDVILMNVQMPEMDGLEASRAICARVLQASVRVFARFRTACWDCCVQLRC